MQLKNAQYIGKVYCAKLSSIIPTLSELKHIKVHYTTLWAAITYNTEYLRIKRAFYCTYKAINKNNVTIEINEIVRLVFI